jgi:hypothetical protein
LRKLTALILICLLVFNWFGYRALLQYLEDKNNFTLQAKLDRQQYDPADLVEIRVPLNLPYITDSKDFENYIGETTINGSHYRFVKRKLANNELILLCIRDKEKDQLQKAGTEFFKQVNDTPGAEKKSKSPVKMVKALSNEFTCEQIPLVNSHYAEERDQYPNLQQSYTSVKPSTPAQPPNS